MAKHSRKKRPESPIPPAALGRDQQGVNRQVKKACDVLRRGNVASALQYVPELTWILFLRILDETEEREALESKTLGHKYTPSIREPYRWRDWARPIDPKADKSDSNTRRELTEKGSGELLAFVNSKLIPHLKGLRNRPDAFPRQKVIAEILSGVERVRIDTETNLLEVLDAVDEIRQTGIDPTHVFAISQVYEGLLLKMGEKGSDAGQFFTPREVIRAMVRVVDPKVGEHVYDPCCGTGGFLAQAAQYMQEHSKVGNSLPKGMSRASATEIVKHSTFYGREKENLIYPISLANLILHGIEDPHIWHGNTLTGQETYGGLFKGAPQSFEVILTNPPFGGKESEHVATNFDYQVSSTQALFLQHIMAKMAPHGRCGMVIDNGLLFKCEDMLARVKRKLLEECSLWAVIDMPDGVFKAAGGDVQVSLLFFEKGRPTEKIWYYDLTGRKIGKRKPLTQADFADFFEKLPVRAESDRSWTVDFTAIRHKAAESAKGFKHTEALKNAEARELRDSLVLLKKGNRADAVAVQALEDQITQCIREARSAASKAQEVENSVYDLKAVNPNKRAKVDSRSATELLDLIQAKGQEVTGLLQQLRGADGVLEHHSAAPVNVAPGR